MPEIILASTSKYRAALLQRWSLSFRAVDPGVDESSYKNRNLSPSDLVRELSIAKARAVADRYADAVVIGSDQVLCHQNLIYGKAGSEEKAVDQLMIMQQSGGRQELITGLCVITSGAVHYEVNTATIKLRSFSRAEAEDVVKRDRSWDCAGSLKIECSGTWLIESLETSDPSAIEGLPLIALGKILRSLPQPIGLK